MSEATTCPKCWAEKCPDPDADCLTECQRAECDCCVVEDSTPCLRRQLAAANARVKYAEELGLSLGMMKSADRPEPYLTHQYVKGSELGRLQEELSRAIGLEADLAAANAKLAEAERDRDMHCRIAARAIAKSVDIEEKLKADNSALRQFLQHIVSANEMYVCPECKHLGSYSDFTATAEHTCQHCGLRSYQRRYWIAADVRQQAERMVQSSQPAPARQSHLDKQPVQNMGTEAQIQVGSE